MTDNHKIMRKIEACMRLSKSANSHEAAAALRQATKLMKKHRISMADIESSRVDVVTGGCSFKGLAVVRWRGMFDACIADAFECSLFYMHGKMVLVGTEPAPTIALYAHKVLMRQLQAAKKDFLKAIDAKLDQHYGPHRPAVSRGQKVSLGRGFAEGWVMGCREVVESFASPVTADVRKRHVKAAGAALNTGSPSTLGVKGAAKGSGAEYSAMAGMQEGRKARIHNAVQQQHSDTACRIASY